jgi:osmoprotectant transport system permease protein
MARRLVHADNVSLTGCVIGLLSLGVGWLTLKPNRLSTGTSLNMWDSFGWIPTAAIFGLWLLCFVLSFMREQRRYVIFQGITLNLLVILTFVFAGHSSAKLLEGLPSYARVSFGAGVWATSISAYISIFSCRQRLIRFPLWQGIVSWSGLVIVLMLFGIGWLNNISLVVEFKLLETEFIRQLWNHIILFGSSVIIGTLLGIPLGIWATRSRIAEKPIFFLGNVLQTIPSLALFELLIVPLSILSLAFPILRQLGFSGIGPAPAIIALILYSLLPVMRNTYVGLKQLDPAVIDAGFGMGMSRWQVFRKIEVPLSAPLVLEGVRTASVQAVGNTAVAALIGAGGLGWFIFQGISQAANDVVILGALPIMGLALAVDLVMRGAVKIITPKGMGT